MQQRNIRNEIVVALSVIVVLAFAITFAVVLSLTNTEQTTATPEANLTTETTAQATEVAQNVIPENTQDTNVDSVTATRRVIIVTPTPAVTNTDVPTETPSATSTLFETLVSMPEGCFLYTVEANDTLGGIANVFGVSAADIARVNSIPENTTLQAGQTLIVPLQGCSLLPTVAASSTSIPTETSTATAIPTEEASVVRLASTDRPSPTQTEQPTLTNTAIPTATNTDTSTATTVPSATPTLTETTTPTLVPTNTATETATNLPTATSTAAPTVTDVPSATPTPTETATNTDVPTATNTDVPTATVTPSATPTLTETPTNTATPVLDIGFQPTPTFPFVGILPTPTLAATYVPTLTAPPGFCADVPQGWISYTVEEGTTLFAIAQAAGVNVVDLLRVNCLSDADSIATGGTLYLPQPPVDLVMTGVPPAATFVPANFCADPTSAQISVPAVGQEVSGLLTIIGTARLPDFGYYRIDLRRPDAQAYEYLLDFRVPVENGVLGQLDTERFENGLYWIRLSVVDRNGYVPFTATCSVAVYIDN